jgi:hypothetical protein
MSNPHDHVLPPRSSDTDISASVDLSVITRVRKLMDKAAATSNVHEADAFSRKAAELVARHRIDEAALTASGREDLDIREIPLGRGAYVRGRLALLMAVAGAHDTRVVFASTPTGTIAYVAGQRSDLDVVEVMYTSLHAQASSRMAGERRSTAAATQRHRRSFLFGYADQVAKAFDDVRREAEVAVPADAADGGVGRSLARVEHVQRVDDFLDQRFGRIRTARSPAGAEVGGWSAGSEAARGADLGRKRLRERRSLGPG